jgi:hypothetical protein
MVGATGNERFAPAVGDLFCCECGSAQFTAQIRLRSGRQLPKPLENKGLRGSRVTKRNGLQNRYSWVRLPPPPLYLSLQRGATT